MSYYEDHLRREERKKVRNWIIAIVVVVLGFAALVRFLPDAETPAMRREARIEALASSFAASRQQKGSSRSSASSSEDDWEDIRATVNKAREVREVIVDQDGKDAVGKKGADWIRATGAVRIGGDSSFGRIEVEISRNGIKSSFQTVALYVAPTNQETHIIEPTLEWRRFRYLGAQWVGSCERHIDPNGSFSTLGVEKAAKTFNFAVFPVSFEDPCRMGFQIHDFLNAFRDTDIVVAFIPSDPAAHVKVTLVHDGGLRVLPPFPSK